MVPTLLGMPAGTRGFRLREKLVVVVVVVVEVQLAVEALGAVPGGFRLKPSVPVPGAAAVVVGAESESPVAVDEVGTAAMEAKSVGPVLLVAAVGVAAAGCVTPAAVVAGVAGVKSKPESAVGWAEVPMDPILKPEVAGWAVLLLVNENPAEVVDGADVAEEPNTNPVGAVPWLEVTALEIALVRVLLPSPKLLLFTVAGVVAVPPKLSFGVLIPREKLVPPEAGVVPKLNPGVCVAGGWVVREKRPEDGVVAAGWEEVPKLNPPVPEVEKENPVPGVVVAAVFAVPNVKPPAGAPVPPKLNPLMAADSGGGGYSNSGKVKT